MEMAGNSGIGMLKNFANTLDRHFEGILAYFDFDSLSTGPLEGTNSGMSYISLVSLHVLFIISDHTDTSTAVKLFRCSPIKLLGAGTAHENGPTIREPAAAHGSSGGTDGALPNSIQPADPYSG